MEGFGKGVFEIDLADACGFAMPLSSTGAGTLLPELTHALNSMNTDMTKAVDPELRVRFMSENLNDT